jgi:hypothetical protein
MTSVLILDGIADKGAMGLLRGEQEGMALDFTRWHTGEVAVKDLTTGSNFRRNTSALDFLTQDGTSTKWVRGDNGQYSEIAAGTPALEYDASAGKWYLLIEPGATNLQVNSQAFDNAAWAALNLDIDDNAVVAPDGATTADTLTDDTVNSLHWIVDAIVLAADTDGAFSVYAKPGTHKFLLINYQGATAEHHITAVFDLSNTGATAASETDLGTAAGTIANTKQEYGFGSNGDWFRLTLSGKVDEANGNFVIEFAPLATSNSFNSNGVLTFAGTGTSLSLWQAQAEVGTIATSPIPTGGSTVARAADIVNVAASKFPFSSDASTLIISKTGYLVSVPANKSMVSMAEVGDVGNDFISIYEDPSQSVYRSTVGGSTVMASGISTTTTNLEKHGFAISSNDGIGVKNGTFTGQDTSVTISSAIDKLWLGSEGGNTGSVFTGRIHYFFYLPRRVPDAELQTMTT